MGSAGNGSPQHLAGEMFKRAAGVDILHVPYKGSGPAMTDLMGGQVLSMIETVPAAQGSIKAGKLRALAVTSAERVPALPDTPTAAEAGLKDFEVSSMFGIVAPAGTPAPVVERLNGELKKILAAGREGLAAEPGRDRHLDHAGRRRRASVGRSGALDQGDRRGRRQAGISGSRRALPGLPAASASKGLQHVRVRRKPGPALAHPLEAGRKRCFLI